MKANGSDFDYAVAMTTEQDQYTTLLPGNAEGEALVLDAPISFWGGVAETDGMIVQAGHPQCGHCVAGKILFLPNSIGSSTSSAIMLELIRIGKAPKAIILRQADATLCLGVIIAKEMDYQTLPVLLSQGKPPPPLSGQHVHITASLEDAQVKVQV